MESWRCMDLPLSAEAALRLLSRVPFHVQSEIGNVIKAAHASNWPAFEPMPLNASRFRCVEA
ncbi:hypothetical protein BRAS3843_700024 [Bradyrhizobium sp. STM 3843]|nr:hypothetical protein BRAS3843_700024 [Bradyrhizobium sp. STM 3843]